MNTFICIAAFAILAILVVCLLKIQRAARENALHQTLMAHLREQLK